MTRARRMAAPAALATTVCPVGLRLRGHPRGRARPRVGSPVLPAPRRGRARAGGARRRAPGRLAGAPRPAAAGAVRAERHDGLPGVPERGRGDGARGHREPAGQRRPDLTALLAAALLGERLWRWGGAAWRSASPARLSSRWRPAAGSRLSGGALLVLGAAAAQATFFVSQKALLRPLRQPRGDRMGDGLGAAMALPLAPGLAADVARRPPPPCSPSASSPSGPRRWAS